MTKAFILIKVEAGREQEALEKLRELEAVEEAHSVYGKCDIIAKVVAENEDELKEIVLDHIGKIDAINSTETLIIIES